MRLIVVQLNAEHSLSSHCLLRKCFPSGLLTNQLKGILVRLEQQERALPNVKHPTATSTSTSRLLFFPNLEEKIHPL